MLFDPLYPPISLLLSLTILGQESCFICWALCLSHYVRYSTHTMDICCQKENKVAVVPFTAHDVFTIMEITFTTGHCFIFFQFQHMLSIWPYRSYRVNSILEKFYWSMLGWYQNCQKTACKNKFLLLFRHF